MLSRLAVVVILCFHVCGVRAQTSDLFEVYTQALQADPQIKIAQYRVEGGKAQQDSAFGALLPQASMFAQFSENDVSYYATDLIDDQRYDGKRYGVQVRQMLFNWRLLSDRAKAEQVVAQREAELLDAMSLLLLDVSDRYFKVLLADGEVRLIKAEQDLVQQQLRETEKLYEHKLAPITDYLETRARVDAVRTDLIEAENQAALAREELTALTGEPVGELALIRKDFKLPTLDDSMEYWTELAMRNNATLAAKQEAVRVAMELVEVQKGGHYPTLDLVLSGQRSDVGFDNQASPKRDTGYIGVDINLPVFSGGSTSAKVREAWSQYYIAREEEEAAKREMLKLTRAAWLNTRSSRQRIDAATLGVESAAKSYEAMSKSFKVGTVKAADVLAALHTQTRAQRDFQDAMYSYLVNWLALKRHGGSLHADDLEQINGWLMADAS